MIPSAYLVVDTRQVRCAVQFWIPKMKHVRSLFSILLNERSSDVNTTYLWYQVRYIRTEYHDFFPLFPYEPNASIFIPPTNQCRSHYLRTRLLDYTFSFILTPTPINSGRKRRFLMYLFGLKYCPKTLKISHNYGVLEIDWSRMHI